MEDKCQQLKEYNALNREMEGLYHVICRKIGLSDSVFIILYTIWDIGDGCLQRDICNAASISKQTIHSAIKKLEGQDVLHLKPGKGREMQIFLTEKGKDLVKEKIVPVAAMEAEAYEAMTEEECHELLRLSRKYLEHFRKKVKEL